MLKDRRELVEKEISKLTKECSCMYLKCVTNLSNTNFIDTKSYNNKLHELSVLKDELLMINSLILEGHK